MDAAQRTAGARAGFASPARARRHLDRRRRTRTGVFALACGVTKERPWWKQTPVAAPDAQRAVCLPPMTPTTASKTSPMTMTMVTTTRWPRQRSRRIWPMASRRRCRVRAHSPTCSRTSAACTRATCPAWRNQSAPIERRTCKHLRQLRGDAAETARVGTAAPPARRTAPRPAGRRHRQTAEAPRYRAAAPARAPLGQRRRSHRLVDEREARRRARLLGRQAVPLAARQPVSRAGLVRRTGLPDVPLDGELWVGAQEVPARRSASSAARTRASDWHEISYRGLRRPGGRCGRSRAAASSSCAQLARCTGPRTPAGTRTSAAAASITCARSWRASRRSAAKG